ncbi:MAG: hypothetical protein ABIT37_06490 [Luteolibacter sp.]
MAYQAAPAPLAPAQPAYPQQQPVYTPPSQPAYQQPVQAPQQTQPPVSQPQQVAYQPPAAPAPVAPVYPQQQPVYAPPPQPAYQQPAPLPQPTAYAQPQPGQAPPQQPDYYQPPPLPQYQPTPQPVPAAPRQSEYQQQPVQQAAPVAPQYTDYAAPPVANPIPVSASVEIPTATQITEVIPLSVSGPAVLRPEPRQLPSRSSQGEQPVAKQMPEPTKRISDASLKPNPLPRHPRQRGPLARSLMALLFVAAAVAIVYGVRTVLNNQTKVPAGSKNTESTVRTILPENVPPPKKPEVPDHESVPSLPVPDPAQPSIIEPATSLPEGMEPEAPGKAADEVLEKFLAAKSLPERLTMIETKTPEAELVKSCLASPLPTSSFLTEARETNAVERVTDVYYNVDFDAGNNTKNLQTILVRTRGTSDPKVVIDPFLDSYGGRLAAYAKTPSDKAGVFQVIISAVASCYDERVPNREKKLTLKLLPRDQTKEIASAYFGRQSKIGMMLEDGTYSLGYGRAKACTVLLRWNTEDNAATPYLEAIDLKRLDWNP